MTKLVFFVDDDKIILNLLEYTLQTRQDMEVQTFLSGEACLENLYRMPSLIVLDYNFKGGGKLSGLETLKLIRKKDMRTPILILTGEDDFKLEQKFFKAGATRFIRKSNYFVDALMESIEKEIF